MEGSESEAVFEALNLNPQLFINEVLNTVDDLLHDAFDYFLKEASSTLGTEVTERSHHHLTEGMAVVRSTVQSILDKRLSMWEEYCMSHCFDVPHGFSMPNTSEQSGNSPSQDALCDPELDAELDSLRNKLATVQKDSAMINQELRALEQQAVTNGHYITLVTEAMQSYNQNSFDQMFQEMATTASELKTKLENLKKRRVEDTERARTERFHSLRGGSFTLDPKTGYTNSKLEDLQEFLAKLPKVRA